MATRWYFPATASNTTGLTPSFDAGWPTTAEAVRAELSASKGTSALAIGTQVGPWTATAGQSSLDRQWIGPALGAQTISGTFSLMLMVREYATTDNVDQIHTGVFVVNSSGTKVATLKAKGNNGSTTEFVNNATHRTHTGANAVAITSYACAAGDRVVVEVGYSNSTSATTPEASARWGENATDATLGDNATTADRAGWIEFSATLSLAPLTLNTTPEAEAASSVVSTLESATATEPSTEAGTSVAIGLVSDTSTTPETAATAFVAPGAETSTVTTPNATTALSVAAIFEAASSGASINITPEASTSASVAASVECSISTAPISVVASGVSALGLCSVFVSPFTVSGVSAGVSTAAAVSTAPNVGTTSEAALGVASETSPSPLGTASQSVSPSLEVTGPVFISTTPDQCVGAGILPLATCAWSTAVAIASGTSVAVTMATEVPEAVPPARLVELLSTTFGQVCIVWIDGKRVVRFRRDHPMPPY